MNAWARGAAALAVAGIALWPSAAAAATSTTVVRPIGEQWFQPNPSCAQPTGCLEPGSPPVPLSPYPSGTLHVGYASGAETARTYLALPLSTITAEVTAATLDIPLDMAPADGSQRPETAHLQVCLFSGDLRAVEGSVDAPPPVSCDPRSLVAYVPLPSPHLYADLTPLLPRLLTSSGIAVLPQAGSVGSADAWRVVFSAHTRTGSAATPPAAVTLTLADVRPGPVTGPATPPTVDSTGGQAAGSPDGSTTTSSGSAPLSGTGFAQPPLTDASPGPTPIVATAGATTPTAARAQLATRGYSYPGVWLLPIALLVLVPTTARALTRDLTPSWPSRERTAR